MKQFETDHTGYLVERIDEASAIFKSLGYKAEGDVVEDLRQRAKLLIMRDGGGRRIELVEPFADNRSLRKMLLSGGPGPYHICYRTDDPAATAGDLEEEGWVTLFPPTPAPALGGKTICYLWRREVGFIELVEN